MSVVPPLGCSPALNPDAMLSHGAIVGLRTALDEMSRTGAYDGSKITALRRLMDELRGQQLVAYVSVAGAGGQRLISIPPTFWMVVTQGRWKGLLITGNGRDKSGGEFHLSPSEVCEILLDDVDTELNSAEHLLLLIRDICCSKPDIFQPFMYRKRWDAFLATAPGKVSEGALPDGRPRGRPPKRGWDQVYRELIRILYRDLPDRPKHAALATEVIQAVSRNTKASDLPDVGTLENKIGEILTDLDI